MKTSILTKMEEPSSTEDGHLDPAVYQATRERQKPASQHTESHLPRQNSSSTDPPPQTRALERPIYVAILKSLLGIFLLLLLISFFITRSADRQSGNGFEPSREPNVERSAAESNWGGALKFVFLTFFWIIPVYLGMQRLLNQGVQGMQSLVGKHLLLFLPSRLRVLADGLQVEALGEVLKYVTLVYMIVAMWSVCGSYSWDSLGYDVCNRPKHDHQVFLSPEDYRRLWTVFHELFDAACWHFQVTIAVVRAGKNWPNTMVALQAIVVSVLGLTGMMLWAGPCQFALVMWNGFLALLGTCTTAWYMTHAEALFGSFTKEASFGLGQVHCELMLYLVVLWTVRWAPVSVFCKTGSCQYTIGEEVGGINDPVPL